MQQLVDHPSDVAHHISCAAINIAEEKVISHPSHPQHSLRFFKYKSGFECDGCGKPGHENGYECAQCNFDLHISCAMNKMAVKQVVQHLIDPGHCLTYVRYPHGFTCNDCGGKGGGNGFGCVACNLDLHKSCSTIVMAQEKPLKHPSHPAHRLSFFKYKRGFKCNGCGEEGCGNGYGCAVCKFDMHVSCAAEQMGPQSSNRLKHSLRYARYPEGFKCNCCGEGGSRVGYGCIACKFDMHISCATLNMAEQKPINHPSHSRHSLSYVRYPPGFFCDECGEEMHGNGYRCGSCNFDLHVRCAIAGEPDSDVEAIFATLALTNPDESDG